MGLTKAIQETSNRTHVSRTPKKREYLTARPQLTERGRLGFGPIQFLMDNFFLQLMRTKLRLMQQLHTQTIPKGFPWQVKSCHVFVGSADAWCFNLIVSQIKSYYTKLIFNQWLSRSVQITTIPRPEGNLFGIHFLNLERWHHPN